MARIRLYRDCMADVPSSPFADRLRALVQRSADLAKEMKVTSEKMEALTQQMAREAERAKTQADAAKASAAKKKRN
jgi:hypothetical protein